jgi:hypothetical protein
MGKMTLIVALFVAAIPALALAAKPAHPSTPASTNANSNANASSPTGTTSDTPGGSAKVLFVLRGTITGYTAGSSVSLKVSASNFESKALKTMTLGFPLNSKTKITGTVKTSDTGIVKLHAAQNASVTTLQSLTAFQVIDQHANA